MSPYPRDYTKVAATRKPIGLAVLEGLIFMDFPSFRSRWLACGEALYEALMFQNRRMGAVELVRLARLRDEGRLGGSLLERLSDADLVAVLGPLERLSDPELVDVDQGGPIEAVLPRFVARALHFGSDMALVAGVAWGALLAALAAVVPAIGPDLGLGKGARLVLALGFAAASALVTAWSTVLIVRDRGRVTAAAELGGNRRRLQAAADSFAESARRSFDQILADIPRERATEILGMLHNQMTAPGIAARVRVAADEFDAEELERREDRQRRSSPKP